MNVTGQRTRHLVEGTLDPLVRILGFILWKNNACCSNETVLVIAFSSLMNFASSSGHPGIVVCPRLGGGPASLLLDLINDEVTICIDLAIGMYGTAYLGLSGF